VADTNVDLDPCPIRSAWILEGNPVARNKVLSVSADGTARTMIWDCTAGRFNWFYNIDETVYVLAGSVKLKDSTGVRVLAADDSIFFPAGSSAEWIVDDYIRKLAFLRRPLSPKYLMVRDTAQRLRLLLKRRKAPPAVSDMFGS
jgi:uncharacterized cupin superfamily protein